MQSATLEAEEATADKTKRSRKRKSAALEAEAPEPKAKVARISKAPEPWRASVVRITQVRVAVDWIAVDLFFNSNGFLEVGMRRSRD